MKDENTPITPKKVEIPKVFFIFHLSVALNNERCHKQLSL